MLNQLVPASKAFALSIMDSATVELLYVPTERVSTA